MENECPYRESLSISMVRRSFLERVFCSFLEDIKLLINDFETLKIDQVTFIKCLDIQIKNLKDLSKDGPLNKAINKAQIIIAEGVFKDFGTEFANTNT